jgi:uncharacterized SAM-binding protein YcdF (DUF218 family)
MKQETEQLCRDINRISAYLALDDFEGGGPGPEVLSGLGVIALLGNQVIATLTAACTLTQRSPGASLLLSGDAGHSTPLLYDNLRASSYGGLVRQGLVGETMAEAEMCAAVAQAAFHIPASRILIENRSRNSAENARFSLQMLKDSQPQPDGTILVLQDPTMQRRSMVTWAREAEIAGWGTRALSHAVFVPEVEPGPDGMPRFPAGQSEGTWTMERFLALILGEIRRLRDDQEGYGPKGRNFLPHVEIPEPINESYERLLASRLNALALR